MVQHSLRLFLRASGILRFADRLGKGVRTAPRDALVADSLEVHELGRGFGIHSSMDTFGAVLGKVMVSTACIRVWLKRLPRVLELT